VLGGKVSARIIHYALAEILIEKLGINDVNRFKIGHMLPDAIEWEEVNHTKSHYKKYITDNRKISDFTLFKKQFEDHLMTDALYLGYYFHLIQDAYYRGFVYYDCGLKQHRGEAFTKAIHNDYVILNKYLVNKYNLVNTLEVPGNMDLEKINEIYPFRIDAFLDQMSTDFTDEGIGKTQYLTESIVDKYMTGALDLCLDEYNRLVNKQPSICPETLSW